jgi:hypothetical protein
MWKIPPTIHIKPIQTCPPTRSSRLFTLTIHPSPPKGDFNNIKTYVTKIYEEEPNNDTLVSIIEKYSTFDKINNKIELPIFEMKCNQNFPMEQTIIPIMKRKLMSYIFQVINIKKIDNFDS